MMVHFAGVCTGSRYWIWRAPAVPSPAPSERRCFTATPGGQAEDLLVSPSSSSPSAVRWRPSTAPPPRSSGRPGSPTGPSTVSDSWCLGGPHTSRSIAMPTTTLNRPFSACAGRTRAIHSSSCCRRPCGVVRRGGRRTRRGSGDSSESWSTSCSCRTQNSSRQRCWTASRSRRSGCARDGSPPKRGLEGRNLGFHLAQFDAAILAGELEIVDALFAVFDVVHARGVRSSYDWPVGVTVMMATGAIELGDSSAAAWIERADESAGAAGSVSEQALLRVHSARTSFS